MSFDFPATIQQDIQQYAKAEHITVDEAALKIVQVGLKSLRPRTARPVAGTRRKAQDVAPITDEELANLDRLCPALKLLDDVTDEEWDDVLKGAQDEPRRFCQPCLSDCWTPTPTSISNGRGNTAGSRGRSIRCGTSPITSQSRGNRAFAPRP
jgi:hypothetical protein